MPASGVRELIAYLATPAAFERLDVSRHDLPAVSGNQAQANLAKDVAQSKSLQADAEHRYAQLAKDGVVSMLYSTQPWRWFEMQ